MYPRFPRRPFRPRSLKAPEESYEGEGSAIEKQREAELIEELSIERRNRIRHLKATGYSVPTLARMFGLQSSQIEMILEMIDEVDDSGGSGQVVSMDNSD